MNITQKLSTYLAQTSNAGYTPSSIKISDEDYKAYGDELIKIAEDNGVVLTLPAKLAYRGVELQKFGPQHKDDRR